MSDVSRLADAIPGKGKSAANIEAGDIKLGVGDIKNDKSIGEGMDVKDGEVNITVNNNNSKTVTSGLASRFNKLPDVPAAALPDNDMSMEK